jgi:hypothetical protein
MRSRWIRAAALVTLLAAPLSGTGSAVAAGPAATPAGPAPAGPPEVTALTLRIRHRVFANFREDRTVRMRQAFQVGDTDYAAQVVRFVPDFAMDTKTRKVTSRSDETKNPAFQIIVKQKGTPQDTTWAFLNLPPHFARNSLLAFQVLRIDFKNRAPVVSQDSLAASPPPAGAPPPPPATQPEGKK